MKKKLSTFGIVIGVAFVLLGLLAMTGALGGDASYPSSAPYQYDSGYATFGTDYYTYSVNNMAEAASAARTAASNVVAVADFLTTFFGLTTMVFGIAIAGASVIVRKTCTNTVAATTETVETAEN